MSPRRRLTPVALAGLLLAPASVEAQLLGPFTWRLSPFCTLVTPTASPQSVAFAVSGFDASVWQTTDPAPIQKIRLGTVTPADLVNAGAAQRGAG